MAKNEKCVASDSALCRWVDKDCKDCYIQAMKHDDEAEKMLENFEVTMSLLPSDFDDLQGDECCFCKGTRNPRAGFALTDLAHSEPESKRGMFFGMGKKVRQRIGSLMPVSISICKQCRRAIRMAEMIQWLCMLGFIGIAVLLLAIPSIGVAASNVSVALPIGIVIVSGVIGYFIGKVFYGVYVRSKQERMVFNIFDIPVVAEMKERGWFTLQEDGAVPRLIFSRKSSTKKLKDVGWNAE